MDTGYGVMEVEVSQFEGLSPEQQRRLSQVLDDYFTDLERGRPPDRDQLAAHHPDLAAPLAAYLDSLDFLHDAAAGFCPLAKSGESLVRIRYTFTPTPSPTLPTRHRP